MCLYPLGLSADMNKTWALAKKTPAHFNNNGMPCLIQGGQI